MERDREPTPDLPTAAEADAALRATKQAHASVAAVPVPWWYWVTLGLLIATVGFWTLLPDTPVGAMLAIGAVLVWAAIMAVIMRLAVQRMGVLRSLPLRESWPFLLVMLAFAIVAAVVAFVDRQPWLVPALSGAAGAAVIVLGLIHTQKTRARVRTRQASRDS